MPLRIAPAEPPDKASDADVSIAYFYGGLCARDRRILRKEELLW